MVIEDVEVYLVSVREAGRPTALVKIITDEGLYGVSELFPWTAYGDSEYSAAATVQNVFRPRLVGKDPLDFASLIAEMERSVWAHVGAKALVDIALHDLAGKILGVPVCMLLGGPKRRRVPVQGSAYGRTPEECAQKAARLVAEGYTAVKAGAGGSPERAIAIVKAIREAVGDRCRVRIDVYQSWTRNQAIRTIRELEQYELEYVEQPVPRHNIQDLVEVTRAVETPIMADESLVLVEDAWRLAISGAVDIFNIRVMKGGFSQDLKMAHIGEACGIAFVVGSAPERTIGSAAGVHLAAINPSAMAAEVYGLTYFEEDVVEESLPIVEGYVEVPQEPGLGVHVDEERLRKVGTLVQ